MTESELYRQLAATSTRAANLLDLNKKLMQSQAQTSQQKDGLTGGEKFFGFLMLFGLAGGGAYYYLFEVGF